MATVPTYASTLKQIPCRVALSSQRARMSLVLPWNPWKVFELHGLPIVACVLASEMLSGLVLLARAGHTLDAKNKNTVFGSDLKTERRHCFQMGRRAKTGPVMSYVHNINSYAHVVCVRVCYTAGTGKVDSSKAQGWSVEERHATRTSQGGTPAVACCLSTNKPRQF